MSDIIMMINQNNQNLCIIKQNKNKENYNIMSLDCS